MTDVNEALKWAAETADVMEAWNAPDTACHLRALIADHARLRAMLVEECARNIYEGWRNLDGWLPWVSHGNSDKQESARHLARVALASRPEGGE